MIKTHFLIGNICFLLLLFSFEIQAQGLEINLLNQKEITAKPGKVTTVVASILNKTGSNLIVQPKFFYPEGWNSITDTKDFEIKAGSKLTKLISFSAPNQTKAEDFELLYELIEIKTGNSLGNLAITVQVEEIVNVSIKGIEVPHFVLAGQEVHAKFIVRNLGNSEQEISLISYNCDIVGSNNILLAPNDIKVVEVKTLTTPNIQKVSRKSFRIEGTTSGESLVKAHAYQHSLIIPNASAEINDIRRLPGYARLSYIGRNRIDGQFISGWQGELFMRGNLDELGEKNLEIKLRGPNQFNVSSLGLYDEYYAQLNTPNYKIHLGDKTYSLSPLTEYARNGRGIEASIRHKRKEFGSFYHRPRFFPEIKEEIGAYARHHFNLDNSISLNYLRKTYRNSNSNASLLSLLGRFNPFKNTYIESEVSQGYHQTESGYAGYLKLESSPINKLRLSSTVLYASRDFPGYFRNTWFYTGSINYSISPKINVFGNIYQDERNAARDTIFSTAPFSKRYQAGLSFRLSRKTLIKTYLRQNELKDQLPSLKFHRQNQSLKLQISQDLRPFRLSAAAEYGKTENFLNPEGEKYSKLFRAYLDINYRLSDRHNFRGFAQFFENNRFDNQNQKQFIFGISGQSRITKSTNVKFQYQNNFAIEEYYRDRNLMEFHLAQTIKKQHEISVSARYALQRQTVDQGDFSVAAHYKYNFGIPLEGKEKQSTLLGQIFSNNSESIEGIVLHLNGRTAVTNELGQFKFKSLAPGKYYLLLDKSSLAIHQIPDIPVPIQVEIIEGQDANISFGLTTSVTISGSLDIIPKKLLTSNNSKMEMPGPILVQLTNGEDTFRQITEKDGTFIFSGLRPGEWNLNIIANDLYKQYIFEENEFELNMKPGQKENIEVRIRKKERKIKFLQSLSLSSGD